MSHIAHKKVAVVTGAGKRLGRQIAMTLAANGYAVVINYLHSKASAIETANSIREQGGVVVPIRADVSVKSQVNKMFESVRAKFGQVDLLVNNAAIFEEVSLQTLSEKQWDTTININLKGVFLCSQAVTPIMLMQKEGRIINIASLGGIQAWSKHIPYSVSKAGVIMLTRCLAKALAPHIMVNAIAPGTIIMEGEEDPEQAHIPVEKVPLRHYGKPSDVTQLILYLAQTANYITGQIISVDGGRSIQ